MLHQSMNDNSKSTSISKVKMSLENRKKIQNKTYQNDTMNIIGYYEIGNAI